MHSRHDARETVLKTLSLTDTMRCCLLRCSFLLVVISQVLQKRVAMAGYRLARVFNMTNIASLPSSPSQSTGGWSSREIGFLSLFVICAVALPLVYVYGRRSGAADKSAEHQSLIRNAAPAPGSSAAAGKDVAVAIDEDTIVHSRMSQGVAVAKA
jgi:hypothetical protein